MTVVEAEKALTVLMILYVCALIFGILASVPMAMHVFPTSECLLFSHSAGGDQLSFGNHASKSFF